MPAKKKQSMSSKMAKRAAVLKHVHVVAIPAEVPVESAVVIVAKDKESAATLSSQISDWLHKAGEGFVAFFHSPEDKPREK